jgi:hypothetical protein
MNKRIREFWTKGLITWEEAEAMNRQLDRTNKAIVKVLTTKYKKDALDAHKEVEDAGFKIYKYDGQWRISGKYRTIYVNYDSWKGYYVWLDNKGFSTIIPHENISKVDFVDCLNKPRNTEYYRNCVDPIHEKYSEIESSLGRNKWNIGYYDRQLKSTRERIEELQKDIMRLQEDLIHYSERKAECSCWLENYRKMMKLA